MGFSNGFLWGAASAAHQVEGAYLEDGKGPGIWDAMVNEPGRIAHGENGNIACDHYHRYKEDVALMKEIGLKSYRFSVNWSRVLPEGIGKVNSKGLKFYVNLVHELLQAGIEPILTLYHWNLPMALYEKGGWKNPESSDWFAEYVSVVASALGDKVKYWVTFNEPQVFVGAGLLGGAHAPFEKNSIEDIMKITRNVLLAHGKAVTILRERCTSEVKISIAPSTDTVIPENKTREAIEKARKQTFSVIKDFVPASICWWTDPVYLGHFPEEAKQLFGEKLPKFTEEEWALVSQPLDFFGFNVYQGGGDVFPPDPNRHGRYDYQGSPRTAMGWCITPDVVYWCCKFFYERYHLPIMITENGIACLDLVSLDGKVHDPGRIDYMNRYLLKLEEAIDEGIPVLGYQYWCAMDNFEWTCGYDMRFGLIYVDYRNQERILKDSAYWYSEIIKQNGKNL